jgi:class 3 adenylate cyclase/tetratricopeptide (TPR) repeat protein
VTAARPRRTLRAVSTCPRCQQENPPGARFCNNCASPLEPADRPVEERKTVTVVFVDLVGFTGRAEKLDPEDVRQLLSSYHSQVRAVLERHGGTVEKFIGDAVMAVFGAPRAHEDDPERAVRSALAIRDWARAEPDLQVRVAVASGEALVSLGARPAEGEGMVAGDVVNTAARVQSAAPVNGVLVDDSTHRATRDAVSYAQAEPVLAKGKAEPVRVWEALEPVARFGVDLSVDAQTPLVGRDRELELLRSLLDRARTEGSTQLVTLVGVPGIGKSRLVGELSRLADEEPELVTWRQGRCLPYGEHVTYWALGEIVKAEAGILESDQPAAAEEKLRRMVSSVVTDEADARWVAGELRALAGLSSEAGGNADAAKGAWSRWLEGLAHRRPTVLVFEDLHWADDGLLDFVDELVDWLRDVPLLVVGTARPELVERRPGWGGGKANSTTISLQPLQDDDSAQLVAALLGRPVQLADEREALLERIGGNPFFAEQYVRMLGEEGATGALPESVQGVIAARLDALPRDEKELLQEAAVQGKVFWAGGVSSARRMPVADADRALRALERKDFVRRERTSSVAGDTQYAFRHVLLRDVTYAQIPRRERGEKHRRAAEWIESLGRPDDHAELLAYHYLQALELARAAGQDDPELTDRAVAALRAAGERALALSAFASVGEFVAEALALIPADDPRRPRLLVVQADAASRSGTDAGPLFEEALERFRAAGDAEGAAEAATIGGRLAWLEGNRAESDRLIDLALSLAPERPDSRARALALSHQTGFHMLGGAFEDAIRTGAEALPRVEALRMGEQRARLHIVIGCARCGLGDKEGLDEIRDGIEIAESEGHIDMVQVGYGNLSSELHFFGLLDEARATWMNPYALAERYRLGRFLRGAQLGAAEWAYLDGRWDEALPIVDGLIAAAERDDRDYTDAMAYALRAWIRLARGDANGAAADTARAVEVAGVSDAQAQSAAYTIGALVETDRGRRAEANRLADELVGIGPVVVPALCSPSPTLVDTAWAFHDLGRGRDFESAILDPSPIPSPWGEAARAVVSGRPAEAAEIVERIGNPAVAAYTRMRAAGLLAAAGKADDAAAQREPAEAFYRKVGAVGLLGEADAPARASGS